MSISDLSPENSIDGGTDGTTIGNVGDSLKVTNQPIPGTFTTFKSTTEVTLTSDTTYQTLHSVSGAGVLVGATFVVDNDTVDCRIQIDGSTIFEFNGSFLIEVANISASYRASGIFGVSGDKKRLYFTPNNPFEFTSSLTFSARRAGKKVKYQLYTYSVV